MELKIKLPIPYSKYDLIFEYRKLISLTELESLIIILIFCKNKGEISKLKKLTDLLKEKYNLDSSFQDLFIESYKKLLYSGVIIANNNEEDFYEVLIGNLNLNKDVESYLEEEKFLGMKEEPINKSKTYISNLILKNGITIQNNNFDWSTIDDENALFYFKNINEKINGNYEYYFNIEANKHKDNDGEAYKNKSFATNEENIKSYQNIFFKNEEIIFNFVEGTLYSTDDISEQIIELFSNNIFYKDFPSIIKNNLETKIKAPNTNENLKTLEDNNINKESQINIKENIYYILDNKIVQLFNKKKDIHLNNTKNIDPFFYNELCKRDFDDYSNVINEFLINDDKKLLIEIYKKVNSEIKKEIINKVFANKELLKNNILLIRSELRDCLNKFKNMKLSDISKLFIEDNDSFLYILKNDHTERSYVQQLKTYAINIFIHEKIIEIYRFSYSGNSYYLFESGLEKEINNFYNKFNSIKPDLDEYKKFKLELNRWKNRNSKNNLVFTILDEKLNSSIKELEIENEKRLRELCIIEAKYIRDIVEPLIKGNKEFDNLIKDPIKKKSFNEKWKFNHQWLHSSNENKKNNYTKDSLLKLEENKKFFMKFKEEIENNINEEKKG